MKKGLVLSYLFLSTASNAEVLESGKNGFTIESSSLVSVSSEQAYQQFLEINEWWNGEHSWFGSADNFYLEPKVGGCFCEIKGEQQALHMTVSFVDPGKELRMLGGLGPLHMMGIHGAMSWKFEAQENGKSKIVQRYAVTGFSEAGLDALAPIVDKVQTEQLQRLVAKLETPQN